MRGHLIWLLPVTLALVACGSKPDGEGALTATVDNDTPKIECAPAGAADFRPVCTMREMGSNAYWRVVNPDGSFHRLERGDSPSGYVTAAGADQGRSQIAGDHIVMTIGNDRYRWPAPQASDAPQ